MTETMLAVLPIALLVAAGALLRARLLREAAFWNGVNALAYDVLFPSLLVVDLSRTRFDGRVLDDLIATVAATLLVGAGCFALRAPLRLDGPTFTSFFQGATRFNSYVFLSVARALGGAAATAEAAIIIALMVVVTNVASVAVLDRFAPGEKRSAFATALATLRNPIVVASAIGAALSLAHARLPGTLDVVLGDLGAAALPMSLLAVGAGIRLRVDARGARAIVAACAGKFVALPFATLVVLRALGSDGAHGRSALLYAALPCAGNAYILAVQLGGDAELMASIVTVSTLTSLVAIPLVVGLLAR